MSENVSHLHDETELVTVHGQTIAPHAHGDHAPFWSFYAYISRKSSVYLSPNRTTRNVSSDQECSCLPICHASPLQNTNTIYVTNDAILIFQFGKYDEPYQFLKYRDTRFVLSSEREQQRELAVGSRHEQQESTRNSAITIEFTEW